MNFISSLFSPERGNSGAVNAAAQGAAGSAQFANEQARQQAAWASMLGDEILGTARAASGQDMQFSRDAMENANALWDSYRNIYQPNETRLANDIANYDSPEELARVRQEAAGNANQAFDTAQASRGISLARMGVNPNSGRFVDPTALAVQRTLGVGGNMNYATQDRRDKAIGLRSNMAQFGLNLPQLGNQAEALGLNANNAGAATMNAGAGAASAIRTQPASWLAPAISGFGTSGNINTAWQNAQTGIFNASETAHHNFNQDAQGWSMLALSSKKAKDKVGRVAESEVVKKIKSMPVDRWRYKKGIVNDEREHIGPYAEDFKARFNVGDGRTINLMDAMGVAFAAVKGLAKDVENIKAARA